MKFLEEAKEAVGDFIFWRKRDRTALETTSTAASSSPELNEEVRWSEACGSSNAKRRRYTNYSPGYSQTHHTRSFFGTIINSLGQFAQNWVKTPTANTSSLNELMYYQPRMNTVGNRPTTNNTKKQPNGSLPPPLIDLTNGDEEDEITVISASSSRINGNNRQSSSAEKSSTSIYVLTEDNDEKYEPSGSANFFSERFTPVDNNEMEKEEEDDDIQIIKVTSGPSTSADSIRLERRMQLRRPPLSRTLNSNGPTTSSLEHSFSSRGRSNSVLSSSGFHTPNPGYQSPSTSNSYHSSVLRKVVNLEERERYKKILEAMGSGVRYSTPPAVHHSSGHRRYSSSEEAVKAGLLRGKSLLNELTTGISPSPPTSPLKDSIEHVNGPSTSRSNEDVLRSSFLDDDCRQKITDLNRKFEFDPKVYCDRIRTDFLPAAESRRKRAEKLQIEAALRREARHHREKYFDEEIRLRLRLEGLVLPEPEEQVDEFPELTDEQAFTVSAAFAAGKKDEILSSAFKQTISRADISTLKGLNWLNDEIILFYMNLIVDRGGKDNFPTVYSFNTFFYPKLIQGGYAALKRWTRKIDIFSYNIILVPVHLGAHWCLAVIDFRRKLIAYYDSMGGTNRECLNKLSEYLRAESLDKKKQEFDMSGWDLVCMRDIPQQMNGSDCGMFACKFAEYVSRDAPITFTQEHMPYFRNRMVYEIICKKLM